MKAHYNINTYISAIYLKITDEVTLATDGVHSRYNVNNPVVAPISLTWTQNSLTGELFSFTKEAPECNPISQRNFPKTKSVLSTIFEILRVELSS